MPRRSHSEMISRSKFATFLQLLAALVLIPAFVNRVVAVPTSGLQERAATNKSFTCTGTNVVASGYYAGWTSSYFPISDIAWNKFSTLAFAFATPSPDSSVISLDSTSAGLLPQFVQTAHSNSVKAILSIGGWSGSLYFSTSVSSQNQSSFVQAALNIAQQYGLDGLDFDWESPTQLGIGCNTMSPSDSANFLQMLQQIRNDTYGRNLILSSAVGLKPFLGSDGNPMTDVSQFSDVLDYITIMDYDVWGSFSNAVGPNSPLNDDCSPRPQGSATSALEAWTKAGFPASKILLGAPLYGHGYNVSRSDALDSMGNVLPYPVFDKTNLPRGDRDTGISSTDVCGNFVPGDSGIFTFGGMITEGFLDSSGNPARGIDFRFDTCSQTPYVYNETNQVMISYDDIKSFPLKGDFIVTNGLLGFSLWELSGDSNNILVDAISTSLGLKSGCH